MTLTLSRIEQIAQGVRVFESGDTARSTLPAFDSCAHIELRLSPGLVRRYSLTSDSADLSHYTIAVLHYRGRRGSSLLHERFKAGDTIEAEAPRTGSALAHSRHCILIAGGIGVTPILSLARELARRGKSFELHYAAHTAQTSRGFPQRRLEQERRGEAGREHPFLVLDRKVKNEHIIDMARPREFDVEKALDQAMRTFWEHGYQGTSMSDLMKASHVQKQSLYGAFGDKHSLFVKCLELYRNQVVSQVKAIVEKTASPFAAVEKVMRYAIEPAAAKKAPQGCLAANTALELGFKDPEAAMQVKRMLQGLERILEGVIKKGQINGEISTRFDSELIAKNLVNTLNGIRVLERTGASARQVRMIVDMALDAIKS